MFFIAYAFKGQVHVFAGRVKIVSHSSCSITAILKYFYPLKVLNIAQLLQETISTGPFVMRTTCRACHGTRVIIKNKCSECKGKGKMIFRRKVVVPVPSGKKIIGNPEAQW